ncbi:TetR/AcrR family transcriptional regulator [Rathayibacter sp. CAU 1779]
MAEETTSHARAPWKWGRTGVTQKVLLGAALELFVERGYAKTSVDDIVQRASSSTGSFYHHFGDKSGIYLALWDDWMDHQEEAVSKAILDARGQGETDTLQLFKAGAKGFLVASWKQRRTGRLFSIQDGPPGFDVTSRVRRDEWLEQNTLFLHASSDPIARLTVSVMTAVVAEASREVMASKNRQAADGVIEATLAMIERLGLDGMSVDDDTYR